LCVIQLRGAPARQHYRECACAGRLVKGIIKAATRATGRLAMRNDFLLDMASLLIEWVNNKVDDCSIVGLLFLVLHILE
jgi:hypothetical protein